MNDLVAFLTARLDEEEQLARIAAAPDSSGVWTYVHGPHEIKVVNALGYHVIEHCDDGADITSTGMHIAHWDPARVLQELEAKREIVRLHGRMSVQPGHPYFNDAHLTTDPMVLCRSCEPERMWRRERSWPCRTLRTLALPYAGHPDYDEAWRP